MGFGRKMYRDDAIVLRAQRLGESDRIITLLTRRQGRVRAVAKGVRKIGSRFGGRLEPFGHVDVQIAEGRQLDVINQAEGIRLHGKHFFDDYARYTVASAMAEAAERLTPIEREPSIRLFLLSLGAFRSLAEGEHDGTLILDAYLLRAMILSGWAPALRECAICAKKGQHRAFHISAGGCVCPDCRPSGSSRPASATITLMTALAEGDWAVADASDSSTRRESSGLVAAYTQCHIERDFRSLSLVERVSTHPTPHRRNSSDDD